ncbi:MAG: hypothetical protein LBU73_02345 [Helicobacteraceae bacterium]|jgi:hypothetical protein|nr:hypothetical protein [Helicobacteraceae bacterium]
MKAEEKERLKMNTGTTEWQPQPNRENNLEIKVLDMHWVDENNPNDKKDLCLHGKLFIRIGNEILSDFEDGSWTLSAASLFLLRTLKMDYNINDFENFLIPCCGYDMIAEENEPFLVLGCATGIEWTIQHTKDGFVKHISQKGSEVKITEEEYRKIVFEFADKVEQFYKDHPRILPADEFYLRGYNGFWREWRKMRDE